MKVLKEKNKKHPHYLPSTHECFRKEVSFCKYYNAERNFFQESK
nr:MAG TPA: hypothetical protein [Caudoviricetes sp.]